jgi:hypothetical protein
VLLLWPLLLVLQEYLLQGLLVQHAWCVYALLPACCRLIIPCASSLA